MVFLAAHRLLANVKRRCQKRRLLRSIIRDASIRYPYPWNEAARARYVTERYFSASLDSKAVVAAFKKAACRCGRKTPR